MEKRMFRENDILVKTILVNHFGLSYKFDGYIYSDCQYGPNVDCVVAEYALETYRSSYIVNSAEYWYQNGRHVLTEIIREPLILERPFDV